MNMIQRPYSGEADNDRMSALASQCFKENMHTIDLPYRFSSWGMAEPDNIGCWFGEDQQLLGWAVMQKPFWAVDIVCASSVENELYPHILAWADQRAVQMAGTDWGLPSWYVNVFSGQVDRKRALELAGFKCQSDLEQDPWSKVWMKRPGHLPVRNYPPPSGFLVRPLAGKDEATSYVDLHRSVFGTNNMTVDWRLNSLKQPAYRPDLDIVVQSPGGQLVAFCVGWLDETTSLGQIEPLGCHKDFRHLALGRVALAEGLKRLVALGVKDIFVETDNYRNTAFRLYESFDFEVVQEVLVYGKDYQQTP